MENREKQIAESIVKASGLSATKLGLRFDQVVVRLLGRLRTATSKVIPDRLAVIVTLTAPIKHPAKTMLEPEEQVLDLLKSGDRDCKATAFQNEVCIRIVAASSGQRPNLIGLVHNPGTDASLLLDLAGQWLLKPGKQ